MTYQKKKYCAFVLSEQSRKDVLAIFPQRYSRAYCHHITIAFDTQPITPLLVVCEAIGHMRGGGDDATFMVTGHYDDCKGVECLSAACVGPDGKPSTTRIDGGTYHLTLSTSTDRKPVHSNVVVVNQDHFIRKIFLMVTGRIEFLDK